MEYYTSDCYKKEDTTKQIFLKKTYIREKGKLIHCCYIAEEYQTPQTNACAVVCYKYPEDQKDLVSKLLPGQTVRISDEGRIKVPTPTKGTMVAEAPKMRLYNISHAMQLFVLTNDPRLGYDQVLGNKNKTEGLRFVGINPQSELDEKDPFDEVVKYENSNVKTNGDYFKKIGEVFLSASKDCAFTVYRHDLNKPKYQRQYFRDSSKYDIQISNCRYKLESMPDSDYIPRTDGKKYDFAEHLKEDLQTKRKDIMGTIVETFNMASTILKKSEKLVEEKNTSQLS